MNGRVLVPHTRNPAAVTRRIEFWEGKCLVTETADAVSGLFQASASYPCASESRFRDLVRKAMYVGDIRCHTVDGVRIFFLEDRRPVVLTTNAARVA